MGSPAFAVPSLRGLVEAGYRVVAAVTQPDRPAGRGGRLTRPEVKVAAQAAGIPVLQPESLKDEAAQRQLEGCEAGVFVVAAYGKILPKAVLSLPAHGSVNVHASLLPRWRGASPIAAAILAGDTETGVSIMELAPKMDAGPVLTRVATPILPADTTQSLERRLAALGGRALIDTLPGWLAGTTRAEPQDDSRATYCSLIRKEDGHLALGLTAVQAERAVRAYNAWPGAYVGYRGQRLAIWSAQVHEIETDLAPGRLVLAGRLPAIAFRGGLLGLTEVQLSGGRRQPGEEFVNGQRGNLAGAVTLA